jgi:hypothetical protein
LSEVIDAGEGGEGEEAGGRSRAENGDLSIADYPFPLLPFPFVKSGKKNATDCKQLHLNSELILKKRQKI